MSAHWCFRALIGASMSLVAGVAAASGGKPGADESPTVEASHRNCKEKSELAATIMRLRQKGTAMATMMELVQSDTDPAHRLSRYFIREAFERPQYRTDAAIAREVTEFSNQMYMTCFKASGAK